MIAHSPSARDFMSTYERATNSHDVDRVLALVDPNATYWFTDGSHTGHNAIGQALGQTWAIIQDETYTISSVEWIVEKETFAVCRYRFDWVGVVDGESRAGDGRGTSVLRRNDGGWKVVHEHLSH